MRIRNETEAYLSGAIITLQMYVAALIAAHPDAKAILEKTSTMADSMHKGAADALAEHDVDRHRTLLDAALGAQETIDSVSAGVDALLRFKSD